MSLHMKLCFHTNCTYIGASVFTRQPEDQTVPRGQNATFTCERESTSELVILFYMQVDEFRSSIDSEVISLRMRKAFIEQSELSITLTILANEENNNTMVSCEVLTTQIFTSDTAILIVHGSMCIIPYNQ